MKKKTIQLLSLRKYFSFYVRSIYLNLTEFVSLRLRVNLTNNVALLPSPVCLLEVQTNHCIGEDFTITEKAPTSAFSLLTAPPSAFKTLLMII